MYVYVRGSGPRGAGDIGRRVQSAGLQTREEDGTCANIDGCSSRTNRVDDGAGGNDLAGELCRLRGGDSDIDCKVC